MTTLKIKTYEDLDQFLQDLAEHINRLDEEINGYAKTDAHGGEYYPKLPTLLNDKFSILMNIMDEYFPGYDNSKYSPISELVFEPQIIARKTDLPSNMLIEEISKKVGDNWKISKPNEDISKIIGTHRSIFTWLIALIYGAPKSKKFLDKYGVFKEPSATPEQGEIGSDDEQSSGRSFSTASSKGFSDL